MNSKTYLVISVILYSAMIIANIVLTVIKFRQVGGFCREIALYLVFALACAIILFRRIREYRRSRL